MKHPISVLMTTEGTYPFVEGGVSTWCDILIRQLPGVEFSLLSLVAQPGLRPTYELPPNVVRCTPVPLWGTGAVNELRRDVGWRALFGLRRRLGTRVAETEFAAAFDLLLGGLLSEEDSIARLAPGVRRLAAFFRDHDYDVAFRHRIAWDLFQEHVARCAPLLGPGPDGTPPVPTMHEMSEALRLLYRWLTPLALPIPRVDVVHTSAAGVASLPGIVAKLERGTSLLLTEHGVYLRERLLAWLNVDYSPFMKFFATRVTRRLVELTYRTADLITPVSSWNERWETRLGATPDQIIPIANGVDPYRFTPQPMPDPATPTIVWVGRIDPLKDLLNLIAASALIKQAIPNVRVLLFGKAPKGNEAYDAACRKLQHDLELDTTVQFMGFAKSPQDAYVQGHLVVLSSISEALPFSVIEAMCCGRPIVATGVGGVPEVVGDAGRVVLPRDSEALAAACIELLTDPTMCGPLGEYARQRALDHYSLQQSVAAYHAVYRHLATNTARAMQPVPKAQLNPIDTVVLEGAPREEGYAIELGGA